MGFAAKRSVWDVLRSQFKLNHEVNRAEVRKQIQWLTSHPHYVQKLAQHSELYIYHIVSEIKKRRLPGELALVPMIESAYDPFAYSGAGAAGLWQFMPGTGSGLGLKQDWWFDGRRHIQQSTKAALSYYEYLNKYFHGNWVLTIAAYDSGEGKISKAIRRAKQKPGRVHFWSLSLPRETKAYIPRLMALAEIIKYAPQYHVRLPNIPYEPCFDTVNVGAQIDLAQAAEYANITYKKLISLNPGFNRWVTPPYAPYSLNLPIGKVDAFLQNIEKISNDKLVHWIKHSVKKNESLSTIARKHKTQFTLIKELNHLKSNKIREGQVLLIPKTDRVPTKIVSKIKKSKLLDRSTSSVHTKIIHIVQSGDTYTTLKNRYDVTPGEIRYWNQIKTIHKLKLGQELVIWKKATTTLGYVIKKGDSLSRLARKFNTSIARLKRVNPSIKGDLLRVGQRINIT